MSKIYYTSDDSAILPIKNTDYWLPPNVLKAQLQDKLLIFCGAGISSKAGLPTFCKLVEEIAGKYVLLTPPKQKRINTYIIMKCLKNSQN